jgi:hypothetical protein
MAKCKGFNEYKIIDDYCEFYITNRKGEIFVITIDIETLHKLVEFNKRWNIKWAGWDYYVCCTEYMGIKDGKPKSKIHYLHRWIVDAKKKQYVDHVDHNTLNNMIENLEITSNSRNNQNRKGINSNNSSGYRNVSWSESDKKWIVQMQIDGKNRVIAKFDDASDAGTFAEGKRKEVYGDFSSKRR